MRLNLITTTGESNPDVLPHMLGHYLSLGVENLIIQILVRRREDEAIDRIAKIATHFGAKPHSINVGPWAANISELLYALPRSSKPNDWFILADDDEFQIYPESLLDILRFCERHGYQYVEGCLVDRLARDGRLESVRTNTPIWDQFPLGGMISAKLLGAVTNKIVAARGHVIITAGQHMASGRGCPPNVFYVPIHHFKWTEGLLERLQERVEDREALFKRNRYAEECRSFIDYYRTRQRIDVTDPRFLIGCCNPQYPYWSTILEWREAATFFAPQLARFEGGSAAQGRTRSETQITR